MSGSIRLLVSDIDGTLVRHDKSLSDAVADGIARARRAGLAVSLISARPPSGMRWIAERLGLAGPFGAFNGGTIFMADGTILAADRLPLEAAVHAIALIDVPGVTPWLFADSKWYARTTENPHVPNERKAAGVEPVLVADFSALTARADKIVGVSDDHALLARLGGEVAASLGSAATVARSQPYYLDVTAAGGNKGVGVTALAAAYGVPLAETAVLGDQSNDLPMFAVAGLSVAMGQAPDAVRAAAAAVSRPNEEDGVADAIDRFVIPAAHA